MCHNKDQVRSIGKAQDSYSEDIRLDYPEVHGHLNVVSSKSYRSDQQDATV